MTFELRAALQKFAGHAHPDREEWVERREADLKRALIDTSSKLASAASTNGGLNDRLRAAGVLAEHTYAASTIVKLRNFLTAPLGTSILRLAEEAGERVANGQADTCYTHRGHGVEDQGLGDERWDIDSAQWTMHVDCSGFVRHLLQTVMGTEFIGRLSDRRFMRAKDFKRFFKELSRSVTEGVDSNETWRRVDDFQMILAGDIIAWGPEGGASAGGAFVKTEDLCTLLKHVWLAKQECEDSATVLHIAELKHHTMPNTSGAQALTAEEWVEPVLRKLAALTTPIASVQELRQRIDSLNDEIVSTEPSIGRRFFAHTIDLMREACDSSFENTGHIVIATGAAEYKPSPQHPSGDWRVPVVHSSGGVHGVRSMGQYKRFGCQDGQWHWRGSPAFAARLVGGA